MASIIVPPYKISLLDKNGLMTREWYKFFAQIATALGNSGSTNDDVQIIEAMESASNEALLFSRRDALSTAALMSGEDLPQRPDYSLFGAWPGDNK